MRTILYVLLSSTSINLVCKALPLPAVHDWYNYDARDADDLVRIEARSHGSHHVLMPVGPGARYPEDDPSHAQSTRLYHPIPPNTYFQTAEHFWTHHDVNAQANQLMGALDHAPTAHSNTKRKAVRTYPKPTSGFRPGEWARDPAHGYDIKYHQPMGATPGNAPRNAHTGHTSMRVGTDRLLAYRNPNDSRFNLGISYHDPRISKPGTSKNHPFSAAPPRRGGRFTVGFTKAKKRVGEFFKKRFGKKKN